MQTRSPISSVPKYFSLTIATVAFVGAAVCGCAPSGDTKPKGEVVEVEVIETAPPAADPAKKPPLSDEATAAKKTEAAKAEADAAI